MNALGDQNITYDQDQFRTKLQESPLFKNMNNAKRKELFQELKGGDMSVIQSLIDIFKKDS